MSIKASALIDLSAEVTPRHEQFGFSVSTVIFQQINFLFAKWIKQNWKMNSNFFTYRNKTNDK